MATTWTKRPSGTTVWGVREENINYSVDWTTATRPASPFSGQTGMNTDFNGLETYEGNQEKWMILFGTWTTSTRPSTDIAAGSRGFNSDTGMGEEVYDGTNWRLL